MNNYIRKAVELADGWRYHHDTFWGPLHINWNEGDELPDELKTLMFDALAAQLVRQLDASNSCSLFVHPPVYNSPGYARILGIGELSVRQEGNDRTMNTIKAIVDSEVLT